MAPPRKGSLLYKPNAGWFARVTVTPEGGKAERRTIKLNTHDEERAQRMVNQIVQKLASGAMVAVAREKSSGVETFREFSTRHLKVRETAGVVMVDSELSNFKHHIWPHIGHVAVADVERANIRTTLQHAATTSKLSKETVKKIKAQLHRYFEAAVEEELRDDNPVKSCKLPVIKSVTKPRSILRDEEMVKFVMCEQIELGFRAMAYAARCLGGMATIQLLKWSWSDIDTQSFASCRVPARKQHAARSLLIPATLQPVLRAWWEAQGKPSTGKVFPVSTGERKGQARKLHISFAERFRRELLVAGVARHELHNETETSLPVDFHSLRRGFVTGLAESNTNMQTAMALSGHSDARVHRRYQMESETFKRVPDEAIPQVTWRPTKEVDLDPPDPNQSSSVSKTLRARRDSNARPLASEAGQNNEFELQNKANRLNHVQALSEDESPWFPMLRNDLSRGDESQHANSITGNEHAPVIANQRDGPIEHHGKKLAGALVRQALHAALSGNRKACHRAMRAMLGVLRLPGGES